MSTQYFLYRSKKTPTQSITIGMNDDGYLFIPRAEGTLESDENKFSNISEIEDLLQDELEMIRKQYNE